MFNGVIFENKHGTYGDSRYVAFRGNRASCKKYIVISVKKKSFNPVVFQKQYFRKR